MSVLANARKVFAITVLMLLVPKVSFSDALSDYVSECKAGLGLTTEIIPGFNCLGSNTQATPIVDEYDDSRDDSDARLGYVRVSAKVDAVFICREVNQSANQVTAAAMIVHNRESGKTCFFDSERYLTGMDYPSPELSGADAYWMQPDELTADTQSNCKACHVRGPYIIPSDLAPAFAFYGLMNNGRELIGSDEVDDVGYHALGTVHDDWNDLIDTTTLFNCSTGCHARTGGQREPHMVADSYGNSTMAPNIEPNSLGKGANYLWVNLDTPDNNVEEETIAKMGAVYPFLKSCNNPNYMEARVVGQDLVIRSDVFPNTIATFNPDHGFYCYNSDQTFRGCEDYSVRFKCASGWTAWRDTPPGEFGDFEYKPPTCVNPTEIEARVTYWDWRGYQTVTSKGRTDALRQFDNKGLKCDANDQEDDQCSNYTVKFSCPSAVPTVRSVWTGKMITRSFQNENWDDAVPKGQPETPSWGTQSWKFNPVTNTEYVRIESSYSPDRILTDNGSTQDVSLNNYLTTGDSQKWQIERAAGTKYVRFRNVGSGNYLTMTDKSEWSSISSVPLDTDWHSQLWILE